jgi:hypothetical protein
MLNNLTYSSFPKVVTENLKSKFRPRELSTYDRHRTFPNRIAFNQEATSHGDPSQPDQHSSSARCARARPGS